MKIDSGYEATVANKLIYLEVNFFLNVAIFSSQMIYLAVTNTSRSGGYQQLLIQGLNTATYLYLLIAATTQLSPNFLALRRKVFDYFWFLPVAIHARKKNPLIKISSIV